MKKPNEQDHLEESLGHLVPRKMVPRDLGHAKSEGGLAPGNLLSGKKEIDEVIVGCAHCKKPIYVQYIPVEVELSKFSTQTKQKPPKSLGDWPVPKKGQEKCPHCNVSFGKFLPDQRRWKYWTNLGWL